MPRRAVLLPLLAVCFAVLAAPALGNDPGRLPQTGKLPSSTSRAFRGRMEALWKAIVDDSPAASAAAFFPRSAYLQAKAETDPGADYGERLLAGFAADVHAAHELLDRGGGPVSLVRVVVPHEWAWIPPGACVNRVGYWHAPGARLLYRRRGALWSFGIYSLISWRGQWYVVHLGVWDAPGTVFDPARGAGSPAPPGGC